jgi:uncharacterized protein YbaP (TraB family)
MSVKHTIIFCLLSLTFPLFSQNSTANKKNHALLWEITGNGLTKPSYLFGTMHLRDKRVFEFSDSMLLKLEGCDAFASEIRMDSAVYQQWELTMSGDTTNKLSRQLSKKGYERLLNALKNKGINLDSMESKNSNLVSGWLDDRDESDKEGSKDLFLDLYLTRLAYNQGKSLHGLERLEDYEDLNSSFFQQFEDSTFAQKDTSFMQIIAHFAMVENMIEVYNSGDLNDLMKIVRDTNSFGNGQYRREILDNRNVKMLQKLENIMREKSVFCAVGAAHLPDSMGLIALLQAKGYAVRKVTPQFTGMADTYKPKKIDRPWYHLKDEFNRIELDFPEQPYLMNKLTATRRRLGMEYVYYDILTGAIHLAEADYYPYGNNKKITKEKVLNETFNNWLYGRKLKNIEKEKIMVGENEGIKFSARSKTGGLIKGQFFVANGNIYKTFVIFDKHKDDETERADKFLNSLKINPLPLTDWQMFEEEKGAFSIKMPVKPDFQEVKNKVPDDSGDMVTYYGNLFMSKEANEGFSYLVRYSDMPMGRYVENDSLYMSLMRGETLERFRKLKGKVEIDSLTRHYGYPEYNVKLTIEGVSMFMRNILRGSRLYMLLGQPPLVKSKANNAKIEDWLNSFRFSPLNQPQLTKEDFPELGISVGLPTSKEPYKLTVNKGIFPTKSDAIIQTTDDRTGAACVVTRTTYSKYYNATNVDSFWNKYTKNLADVESDKLKITVKDTLFKGVKAKLVSLDYLETQNTFKSIVFLKDGHQYDYTIVLPYEIANDAYANLYFETINFMENKDKQDIFASKKPLIISDLASESDSIRDDAKKALRETVWLKEDLSILIDALQKNYTDDTLKYNSTRLNLLNEITQFKDVSTLNVLEKLVKTTEKDSSLRQAILCAFLELDTLNSADRFFDVVKSMKTKDLDDYYCLNSFMTDSIARAKLYYDKLLSLSEKPFYDNNVISISASLATLDTLKLMRDIFTRYTPQYVAAANDLWTKNREIMALDTLSYEEGNDYYALNNYIDLFKDIPNTPEINQFLKKTLTANQKYTLSSAVHSLTKNGQSIENSIWAKLLKDKSNFYSLLNSLKYDSLLSVVPPQYLNQKDIAEGIILDYLSDEYGEPKEFNFIETQKYKGELLYVYKCKMDYGDEENNYLITLCSQPSDKTKYSLEASVFLISEAQKDAKGYKKVVSEMLKDYEKSKNE